LSGVVNFVLDSNYEGFDVGYQFGQTEQGDGAEKQIDVLMGGNFADGRGNLTAFASWYERDSILQGAREFTRVDKFGNGSSIGNARMPNAALNPFPTTGAFLGDGGTGRDYAFDSNNGGGVRSWNNSLPETSADGRGDRYNFAPVNFLLSPGERLNIGAFGHWNLSETATAYAELMFVDSRNANQLAPTPAQSVPFDPKSPLLSAQARALLDARANPDAPAFMTRRMVEVGPRLQENKSKLQQITLGMRGDLPFGDWAYDVYYQYGRTDFINVTHNDVSKSKFSAAASGCPAEYRQFVPNCVPLNAFGVGSVTPEMADFIRLDFTDSTLFERNLASVVVDGGLGSLPAGPIGVAIGLEYREDSSDYTPDIAKAQGDIMGFNAQQPIAGKFDVGEIYVEALVPLLKDLPAVESLNLDTGARYSDYSSVGRVAAYKTGLDWSPVDSLHVRGMYQRAVRAPSVFELFQAGDQSFPQLADPCASRLANGRAQEVSPETAQFCRDNWGIDSTTFAQSNSQVESFYYGNQNLTEETSDTYTIGIAATPKAVPGLHISLDYYRITVEDYVSSLAGGVAGVIQGCFESLDLKSDACHSTDLGLPLVYRDALGDLKTRVPTANLSALRTSGVDLNFGVDVPLPFAQGAFAQKMNVSLLATWLESWELDDIEYAGTISSYNYSGAFPEWKANLRLAYSIGPVDLTYNLEYLASMDNQGNIPEFEEDDVFVGVGSAVYHDVSAQWQVTDAVELSVGVRNLTDKQPQYFDFPIDMNTDPSTYDVLGRSYFASLRARF
jgi:outer membrane receptor protein involved in Fe transport